MLKRPKIVSSQPGEVINWEEGAHSNKAFRKGLNLLPVGYNCVRIAPPLNMISIILFDVTKAVDGD